MTFGTAGVGTSAHLVGEMLSQNSGASLLHVAYKGSAQAQADLLGGHLDLIIDALSAQMPMVEAHNMKLIALASPHRGPRSRSGQTW